MKEIKTATSISIPTSTLKNIRSSCEEYQLNENISEATIILLCLKLYLKTYAPEDFSSRPTCQYNFKSCHSRKKIYLTTKEHHNLKIHRTILNISASYLCDMAVIEFLPQILKLLSESQSSDKNMKSNVNINLASLKSTLDTIHRKVTFRHQSLLGLRIVIPKPNKHKDKGKNSGHQGYPWRLRESLN